MSFPHNNPDFFFKTQVANVPAANVRTASRSATEKEFCHKAPKGNTFAHSKIAKKFMERLHISRLLLEIYCQLKSQVDNSSIIRTKSFGLVGFGLVGFGLVGFGREF